ncbi:SAM-dependent methyltransferase [Intrasporangium sp.]|uniref:SAM-dependent methyltransferase n=1 Tax=Intrasporangium sp. TaxID=1925024 RepID=UPI003221A155
MGALPWSVAWQQALYDAELGFYVTRGGPAAHFTTASHGSTGPVLAEALLRLWHRYVPDRAPSVVVDIGAGRGELTSRLARLALPAAPAVGPRPAGRAQPPGERTVGNLRRDQTGDRRRDPRRDLTGDMTGNRRRDLADDTAHDLTGDMTGDMTGDTRRDTRVVGVDVVDRPAGLDARVEWLRSPGGAALPTALHDLQDALVIANEWLDVVPCTVAEVADDGTLCEVLVDPSTGDEELGPKLTDPDAAWAASHWPTRTPGERVEVGRTRDLAWAGLVSRVASGLLVAVDYGHLASERPSGGTLAAYRAGHLTRPVPDGTCDLTAHVAVDSLAADEVHRQRDLLVSLGLDARPPDHTRARTDPAGYLRDLERRSAQARLIDPSGYGGFWWVLQRKEGADVP